LVQTHRDEPFAAIAELVVQQDGRLSAAGVRAARIVALAASLTKAS